MLFAVPNAKDPKILRVDSKSTVEFSARSTAVSIFLNNRDATLFFGITPLIHASQLA